ncbi:MAG: hypothetical protein NT039_03840 [Candidatus Berkelbacteria bacterium]|nr:hypothetical protein [Candidatus Berkelbacteria bacterium]
MVKNFIGQPTKPGARVKLVLDKGLWIDGRAADIFGANLVEGFGLGVNTESKRICENLLGNRLTIRGMLPNGGVGTSEVAIDLRFLAGKDAQPSDSKQLCVHLMVRGPGDKKWHETQSMGWDYWADPNQ